MNGDSDYIDEDAEEDGEEAEEKEEDSDLESDYQDNIKWLNWLGDQIVSYFLKDAVYSFPYLFTHIVVDKLSSDTHRRRTNTMPTSCY